jgi:proteic killer suppression protein
MSLMAAVLSLTVRPRSFRDRDTEAIFRQRRLRRFQSIASVALRRLVQIDSAEELRDLVSPPANHLEALKGDREGQYSVRINDQYRVCFRWKAGDAFEVEIADYH